MPANIGTTAQNYKKRLEEDLAGTPFFLEMKLMSGQPITEQDAKDAEKHKAVSYEHREEIPEAIRHYADIYHKLTGQEPTKRSFSDWLETFWTWKDERLAEEDIQAAWAQAQNANKGFTVGRPGALTITAVGMKSKSKPVIVASNSAAVEATQRMLEEKDKMVGAFVPMPDDVRQRLKAKLKRGVK